MQQTRKFNQRPPDKADKKPIGKKKKKKRGSDRHGNRIRMEKRPIQLRQVYKARFIVNLAHRRQNYSSQKNCPSSFLPKFAHFIKFKNNAHSKYGKEITAKRQQQLQAD